jgi:uncharacterized membrane protein HdeD (DUF308 family)
MTETRSEMTDAERTVAKAVTGLWWLPLVVGIAWLLVAMVVLRFTTRSVTTVGVLLGFVLLGAALTELLHAGMSRRWRWVHVALGVLFAAGSVWAFVNPQDAFWSLAAVFGLLLVLRGSFDIVLAAMTREVNHLWGLGLATGILEVLLGFWASQQYQPAQAALLLVWIGFGALFRGIAEIVMAFELRGAGKDLAAA